ncbi:MAG: hypothetical protein JST80_02110 [Bdellovibrionales bacterium]|nr:hypothetical protein [Bdellovibrionales bacterium]
MKQERTPGIASLSAGLILLLAMVACSKNAHTDYQTVTDTQVKAAHKLPVDNVCNARLLDDERVSRSLFHQYRIELAKAVVSQLHHNNWRGKKYISVQNIPNEVSSIAPQYCIRVDLESRSVLRNKTMQTALKIEAEPLPGINGCQLTLKSRGPEYLVNQNDVPTNIYIPEIQVMHVVRFKGGTASDLQDMRIVPTKRRSINPRGNSVRPHASSYHNNIGSYRVRQKHVRYKELVDEAGIGYITE